MNSVDPINTVGSVLTGRANVVGDIVKVGRGVWGLASWYPGRSLKKKGPRIGAPQEGVNSSGDDEETTETVAPKLGVLG